MSINVFSVIISTLLSTLFILSIHFFRNRDFFLRSFGIPTVLFLYVACVFRMLFAFETPFTVPIRIPDKTGDLLNIMLADEITVDRLSINVIWMIGAIWLIGILITLGKFIVEHSCASQKMAQYYECNDQHVSEIIQKVRDESARKLSVRIYISPDVNIPMGVGILHKRIFLPEFDYPDSDLYYILKHEYTHFCNHDLLIKFLARIFCCVFWWNPVVYLLKKDISQILEIKCDRVSTLSFSKSEKLEYLRVMVELMKHDEAENLPGMKANSAQLFSKTDKNAKKYMVERFDLIIKPIHKTAKLYQGLFLSISLLILVASYSFVFQPAYEAPVEEILTGEDTILVDTADAYILKHSDGTYSYVLNDGSMHSMTESTVKVLVELDGIEIKEE